MPFCLFLLLHQESASLFNDEQFSEFYELPFDSIPQKAYLFYAPFMLSLLLFRALRNNIILDSPVYAIRKLHYSPEPEAAHQFLLNHLFKNCKTIAQIKQIHSHTIQNGLALDSRTYSKILTSCCIPGAGSNEDMNYARQVFDTILEPNVFLWNTMIKGYSLHNCPQNAVSLYKDMLEKSVKPDNFTFPFLLKAFSGGVFLEYVEGIHGHICKFGFEFNESVQHSLIHAYCLCGKTDGARLVFDMSAKRNVVIWNEMISGYNKMKQFKESKEFFDKMEEKQVLPTSVTLVSVLSACSELKDLDAGIRVHQYVKDGRIEPNLTLNNTLLNMYVACGEMDDALSIFNSMKVSDAISWTTMIKGFAIAGQVDQARRYFEQMPQRDSVSWTAMMDGYLKMNQYIDVLLLFREMQAANVKHDKFTIVSVLTACAHLGALELGEWIRAYIDKYNIENDVYVGNALVDMYFKCGEVEKAMRIFHRMPRRDKFTWTAAIVGLAINGHGREALNMFSEMLNDLEIPDEITYVGVLSACTHCGMVNEGRNFFNNMTTRHGIEPNVMHYGCMVDLLGRAGHLREAYEVTKAMPMRPNSVVWGALLGACRVHKDAEMAEMAAERLLELEPQNEAVYVPLCNTYAACKKWDKLRDLRKVIMERGIKKTPGCSLIEMNNIVHEFVAGDTSHPQFEAISLMLEGMTENLKLAGYLPDTSDVFLDIRAN